MCHLQIINPIMIVGNALNVIMFGECFTKRRLEIDDLKHAAS